MMRGVPPQDNQQQQQQQQLPFVGLQQQVPSNGMLTIGLTQLQTYCFSIHQHQDPICLRPNKSFISAGGSDPLDYIYIFKNEGDSTRKIPKHWHYVGLGLSDIYSYGMLCGLDRSNRALNPSFAASTEPLRQLYPLPGSNNNDNNFISGFGFELSFRVKCDSPEAWTQEPPRWPAQVMQALARYVFQSKNVFSVGDHAAWNRSLDGDCDSRIEHMLMTLDPQLKEVETFHGKVKFIQLVGVCTEELESAREFNVRGILDIMREREETGGEFLVTDMRRGETIFELDPENQERIDIGIKQMGSDMALISAKHKYCANKIPDWYKQIEANPSDDEYDDVARLSARFTEKEVDKRCNLSATNQEESSQNILRDYQPTAVRNPSRMSYESISELMVENAELQDTRFHDSIYILLSYESAKVLPVALNGRLAHKRPFTFQSFKGDLLTTLIPEGSDVESLVTRERPFAKRGAWLQIYVSDELRILMLEKIQKDFNHTSDIESVTLPNNYSWPSHKLYLTVVDEIKEAIELE